jgi:hypothetical protein
MKIHPPIVAIDESAPFKHALFGRKAFAESLSDKDSPLSWLASV